MQNPVEESWIAAEEDEVERPNINKNISTKVNFNKDAMKQKISLQICASLIFCSVEKNEVEKLFKQEYAEIDCVWKNR